MTDEVKEKVDKFEAMLLGDLRWKDWPASDLQEQRSLLQLADRRADMWFQVALVGWGCAIVGAAMLIWMTVIWPR